MQRDCDNAAAPPPVTFTPSEITRRHAASWCGIHADAIQVTRFERFEYSFRAPYHVLIAGERSERYEGETAVEGLPVSVQRNLSRRLTFVPAGRQLHGWQKPRALTQVTYFYIDPRAPLLDPELRFAETTFAPRLFFFDRDLWETTMKLKAQVESPQAAQRSYAEALGLVLLHELMRVNDGTVRPDPIIHGGLAAWQQKRVTEYLEEHLAEDVSLATLAALVRLSPYHFSRAFRHSFGTPPHRYHIGQRVEHAKSLLANASRSVTEIGQQLGFSETSAFTATFRKFTGRTPTDFRRTFQ